MLNKLTEQGQRVPLTPSELALLRAALGVATHLGDRSLAQIEVINAAISQGSNEYVFGSTVTLRTNDAKNGTTYTLTGIGASAAFVPPAAGNTAPTVPLSIAGTPVLQAQVGTPYSFGVVAGGGASPYAYSVVGTLPAGLALNSVTGVLSGTPSTAGVASNIVIRVTDALQATADLPAFTLTVSAVAVPLTIGGTPPVIATVGTPYSFTPTVNGGVGARTFALAAGPLPGGLTLNTETGAITGTPTSTGTSTNISIRVTDSTTAFATLAAFQIAVGAALSISGAPVTAGQVGAAYAGFSVAAAGGTGPYTFSVFAGTLPPGLALNGTTGAITGTPTSVVNAAGIIVRATDAAGATANLAAFSINVIAAAVPVTVAGTPVTSGTVGTAYAGFSASASGGTGPYTYSLHAGTLPAGLTLNASTGAVSGTPTAVVTRTGIVIRATDSLGAFGDLAAFQIAIAAAAVPVTVSGTPVTSAVEASAYAGFTVSASGGTAPFTFSVVGGALPAGLSLNASTGVVSGTPTTVGTQTGIVIRATDSLGAFANLAAFQIAVGARLSIAGTPSQNATIGVAYSFTPTTAGGAGAKTFSLASGTLPAGLSLNTSTGAITGSPTTAGASSNIVLRVTDTSGTASLAAFTLTVTAALTISGTPATTGQVGTAYAFTPTAAGGVVPRTFALVAGTLPAGLSFEASTGAITGSPTTAGTAAGLSIRVTDSLGAIATLPSFDIAVAAMPAIVFTTQPQNQAVSDGQKATIGWDSTNTTNYQVQVREAGSTTWSDVGAVITAKFYETPVLNASVSGRQYRVVANPGGAAVPSQVVTVVVLAVGAVTFDSTTKAEQDAAIAVSADKMTWLAKTIQLFGAAPRYLLITRNGTTVFNGLLEGEPTQANGRMYFGHVAEHVAALAGDFSSGTWVFRIESASRFAQGSIGLPGSGAAWIIDASLPNPAVTECSVHLNGCCIAAPLALAESPDIELYRVNVVNDAAQAQAADFSAPMFGAGFARGDIPAGTYPHFRTAAGVACPATLHSITYWPDGSMKFAGVLLNVPAAVPATSALAIGVRSGGSAPVAGTRTTADLTAADINVQLVGVDGLTGTWGAMLNNAIATGTVEKLGDGPAGALWRIGGEVRDGSNAAHGQLYCWHYVVALSNASGSLRGLRYLGRVAQPWIDVATPTPRHRDLQATLRRGTTVIRVFQGHTDTETPGGTIRLPHFASFLTAGTDAKWDYIQGGGSASADSSVRVTLDAAYLIRSKVIPPFDLANAATVYASVDHIPMGKGTYQARGMGQTGGRPDIGLWTDWCVTHLSNQTALNERILRANAMLAANWRIANRRQSTGMPALYSPMPGSYSGLGVTNTPSPATVSPNLSLWAEDGAHFPNPLSWAYVFSGEPQYLDLMQDRGGNVQNLNAGTKVLNVTFPRTNTQTSFAGVRTVQMGSGGPLFHGTGMLFQYGGRIAAWALRDVGMAAGFSPDSPYKQYLTDVLASNFAAFKYYGESQPSTYRDAGLFILQNSDGAATGYESPWMSGYLGGAVCAINDLIPSADGAYMQSYLSRFWTAHAAVMDPGSMMAYRHSPWDGNGNLIASAAESLFTSGSCTMSFTAADSRGTINGANWSPTDGDAYAFCVGAFSSAYPFPQATFNKRLYAVNCVGKTLQLAETPGGAPITVPADVNCGIFLQQAKNLSPDAHVHSTAYTEYFQIPAGVMGYYAARGETGAKALFDIYRARSDAKGFPNPANRFNFSGVI
jgi:hypothetical protein